MGMDCYFKLSLIVITYQYVDNVGILISVIILIKNILRV